MTPQQQRYNNLTMDQLRGADYALRLLRTSFVIRGEALKVLKEQISEVREEMTRSRAALETACPHFEIRDGKNYCCCQYDEMHDAVIRKDERERVLVAAKSLPFHCFTDPKSDIGNGMSRFIRLSDLEEHLREQSQQERDAP